MNFFIKLYTLFFLQDSFFDKVKKEPFQITLLFFISMLVIQFIVSLYGILGIRIFLLYSLIVILSLFIIYFLVNIYSEKAKLKKVFISYTYSLVPVFLFYIIISYSQLAYDFVLNDKPFIILLLGLYVVHLFSKGLKIICNVKKGLTYSSLALYGILAYIIYRANLDVIIFYSIVLFILYIKRKKFTPQGIVLLYKSKIGLKSMDKLSKKYPKLLNICAWGGIVLGFILMAVISFYLIHNAIELVTVPDTVPGVAPILPGIPIPGSPIDLPLWYGLISIFIVVVVHEFSHGVIARLYNIKVKSSGLFFMGPIIGAFIEPDDKSLEKSKTKHKLGVLGAGPFSNVILALIVLLIMNFALSPLFSNLLIEDGTKIGVLEETPAHEYGLQSEMVITKINDLDVIYSVDLLNYLNSTKPGQNITIYTSDNEYNIILSQHPERNGTGYLGVTAVQNYKLKDEYQAKYGTFLLHLILILMDFFLWLFIISLGIGIANLIPFGPADGGRMLYYILLKFYKEDKAKKISASISTFFIVLILFVLFFPLFKWIGSQFML